MLEIKSARYLPEFERFLELLTTGNSCKTF